MQHLAGASNRAMDLGMQDRNVLSLSKKGSKAEVLEKNDGEVLLPHARKDQSDKSLGVLFSCTNNTQELVRKQSLCLPTNSC